MAQGHSGWAPQVSASASQVCAGSQGLSHSTGKSSMQKSQTSSQQSSMKKQDPSQ